MSDGSNSGSVFNSSIAGIDKGQLQSNLSSFMKVDTNEEKELLGSKIEEKGDVGEAAFKGLELASQPAC